MHKKAPVQDVKREACLLVFPLPGHVHAQLAQQVPVRAAGATYRLPLTPLLGFNLHAASTVVYSTNRKLVARSAGFCLLHYMN